MKRTLALLATVALVASLPLVFVPRPGQQIVLAHGDTEIVGALVNPGFEGIFHAQDGDGPLQLADGWTARWTDGNMGKPGIDMRGGSAEGGTPFRRPEWKRATVEFPYRVRSGDSAQQWFSFYGLHYAGIYQQAKVTPGDWFYFTVYGQGWSSGNGDPLAGGDIFVSLGIDPTCATDPENRAIQWTDWQWLPPAKVKTASLDNWTPLRSQTVQATGSCATVYIWTTAKWPAMHNDAYFDDVQVWKRDLGSGTVVTATPRPTYTPYPTLTPYPTYTPQPTVVAPILTPCPTCVPSTGDCLTKQDFDAGIAALLTQMERLFRRLTLTLAD